jgi:hypothetical protein
MPDVWLTYGNPWEIKRPDVKFQVAFGGKTTSKTVNGKKVTEWMPSEKVGPAAACVCCPAGLAASWPMTYNRAITCLVTARHDAAGMPCGSSIFKCPFWPMLISMDKRPNHESAVARCGYYGLTLQHMPAGVGCGLRQPHPRLQDHHHQQPEAVGR